MNLEFITILTTTIANDLMCTIAADLELNSKIGKPPYITILALQDTQEHQGTPSRTQLWSGCLNRSRMFLVTSKMTTKKIMTLNTIVNHLNAEYTTEKTVYINRIFRTNLLASIMIFDLLYFDREQMTVFCSGLHRKCMLMSTIWANTQRLKGACTKLQSQEDEVSPNYPCWYLVNVFHPKQTHTSTGWKRYSTRSMSHQASNVFKAAMKDFRDVCQIVKGTSS